MVLYFRGWYSGQIMQSDVTVTSPRSDRKTFKRECEKKITAGRKSDGREDCTGSGISM